MEQIEIDKEIAEAVRVMAERNGLFSIVSTAPIIPMATEPFMRQWVRNIVKAGNL